MNLLKIFWIRPLKKNQVLYLSFDGKQVSDSPKYIYKELLKRANLSHVWALSHPEKFSNNLNKPNTVTVNRNSFAFIKTFLESKYIVTNNHVPSYLPIRKNQVLLNTWHGGSPLKTVGFLESHPAPYNKYYFKIQNKKYSAFISSSDFMTKDVFGRSFHYTGQILPFGMPRNAILFRQHKDVENKVFKYYGIENDGINAIVLYAPTFRGSTSEGSFLPDNQMLDIENTIKSLNKRFDKKFTLLFRAHHTMKFSLKRPDVLSASDYPDMQELLCAADVLITDYSSCMGDMCLMYKPIFLYTPDLGQYMGDRGFYWDIHSLPFPIANDSQTFCDNIEKFDENTYKKDIDNYLRRLGSYENEKSVNRTVEWLLKQ